MNKNRTSASTFISFSAESRPYNPPRYWQIESRPLLWDNDLDVVEVPVTQRHLSNNPVMTAEEVDGPSSADNDGSPSISDSSLRLQFLILIY